MDKYITKNLTFSEFIAKVELSEVKSVQIKGNSLKGLLINGETFNTHVYNYPNLVSDLKENGVKIEILPLESKSVSIVKSIFSWLPKILWIIVLLFFIAMHFKMLSRSSLFTKKQKRVIEKLTFADVAGVKEAKDDLKEIVEFLRDPEKFESIGGKMPKGCLLTGDPGNGKSLLAKAIAGEAGVPFFSLSGSDFVEMFVGVGASRVRNLFEQARKHRSSIIFIDEIDAVGGKRNHGFGSGSDERNQTLNQLLVEMDGCQKNSGVIVIAATNTPDVLDPALLRQGRFDKNIIVPYPDINSRKEIINVHLRKVKHDKSLDVMTLARGTPGFSGADLAGMINEAALLAGKNGKNIVELSDLENAKDKIVMGSERKSQPLSSQDRLLVAYHEAGHAIVSLHVKEGDPIHKATIVPRGRALGMVVRFPLEDRVMQTRAKLESNIAVAMGGRIAEEMIFGRDKVTSGASSDIHVATKYARAMVIDFGMSDKVGPVCHTPSKNIYSKNTSVCSEYTSQLIDKEVYNFISEGYKYAQEILTKHKQDLHTLAQALIEKETLTGEEIKHLLQIK